MTGPLARCDVCTPLGHGTHQRADEAAVYVEAAGEWLCEHCRIEKGYPAKDYSVPEDDGVYSDIPDTVYHADRDSLSSSGARTILWEAPAKFLEEQNTPPNPKKEYDFGHGAHKFVLGVGEEIVEVDADTWRGKDAGDTREKAWAEGKIPLLSKDVAKAREMAKRVLEHPIAAALLSVGDPEITGYWHDPITGVRLRWRADWLHPGRNRLIIVDYKTSKNAQPAAFHRSIADYRYHQQDAFYRDGVIANEIDPDPLFLFIAQEKTPPYLVSVHELRDWQVERGRALNRKAIDTYARCRERNEWPGYGDHIHTVDFPTYVNYREEDMLK